MPNKQEVIKANDINGKRLASRVWLQGNDHFADSENCWGHCQKVASGQIMEYRCCKMQNLFLRPILNIIVISLYIALIRVNDMSKRALFGPYFSKINTLIS